jgi:hypothetical protein
MRTFFTHWLTRHITGPLDAMYARLDENQNDGSYAPDPDFRLAEKPAPLKEHEGTAEMRRANFNPRQPRERV